MRMKWICVSLIIAIFAIALCACATEDSGSMDGAWQFCGVVEQGDECIVDNIIKGDEFRAKYGSNASMNSRLEIDDDGVKSMFKGVPGTEVGDKEVISESQFRQKITITAIDGESLKEPVVEEMFFTLKDGYLFVEVTSSDSEYNLDNVNVYQKVD